MSDKKYKNIHLVDEKKRNTRTTIRFYVISLFLLALVYIVALLTLDGVLFSSLNY